MFSHDFPSLNSSVNNNKSKNKSKQDESWCIKGEMNMLRRKVIDLSQINNELSEFNTELTNQNNYFKSRLARSVKKLHTALNAKDNSQVGIIKLNKTIEAYQNKLKNKEYIENKLKKENEQLKREVQSHYRKINEAIDKANNPGIFISKECSICFDELTSNIDNKVIFGCGHYVCLPCCSKMLKTKPNDVKCPTCRYKVDINPKFKANDILQCSLENCNNTFARKYYTGNNPRCSLHR